MIEAVNVVLPNERDRRKNKFAKILMNVFSPEECNDFIARAERSGFEPALVNTGGGRQELITDVRQSDRCIMDDNSMAAEIFRRIKPYIPGEFMGCPIVGLNERLRFLKYNPGDYFKPHCDGSYVRPDNSQHSLMTVLLYLNSGMKGGSTKFVHDNNPLLDVEIVPEPGLVLIFQHDIYHEGTMLEDGVKFNVRSDVMFRRPIQRMRQDWDSDSDS